MHLAHLSLVLLFLLFAHITLARGATPSPDYWTCSFETTVGNFSMHVNRTWSPLGADRFYELVMAGYYDQNGFFRVLPTFVVQFGISGDPNISAKWVKASIKDDPVLVSNIRGRVAFATAGPNTRTTQLFINYADNTQLDKYGFSPFAEVPVDDIPIVQRIYSGYGQEPNQNLIYAQGNSYLKKVFPLLDFITRASVKERVMLG